MIFLVGSRPAVAMAISRRELSPAEVSHAILADDISPARGVKVILCSGWGIFISHADVDQIRRAGAEVEFEP